MFITLCEKRNENCSYNHLNYDFLFSDCSSQILLKASDDTVMEAVDPEVSVTCMDISRVKKVFQLALLCTKRQPSDRPSMHEVARVLVSLVQPPATKKPSPVPLKPIDYARFVISNQDQQHHLTADHQENSSDAQWFVRFQEVVSKNTL